MNRREALQLAALAVPVGAALAQTPPVQKRSKMWDDLYSGSEQIVNPFPNRFLTTVLEGRNPGRALDIGMGQGRNTLYIASQGWDTTGVDISEKGIELARKQFVERKLTLNTVVSEFGAFDLGKSQWDLISEMYMHGMVIQYADRVVTSLRPRGILVVEGFHKDGKLSGSNGVKIGFAANELLAALAPKLRIVRYEEVFDFGDWALTGEKTMLVRMIAQKDPS